MATRIVRGRPSTVSWLSASPGLGTEHDRQVLVGAQFAGCRDDQTHDEVFEVVDAGRLGGEPIEELGQFAHLQGTEQDFLATGKQAVQGGSRHAAGGGDVVDRDLGDAPLLTTPFGGIEYPRFSCARPHP